MPESVRGPANSVLAGYGSMFRAMKAEPDGFLRLDAQAENLASELTVQSATSLLVRMASLNLKQEACR